jgi:hypothetical protein
MIEVNRFIACGALVLTMIFAFNVNALNWEGGHGVSITSGYDDNYSLLPDKEIGTSFARAGVFLTGEGSSETNLVRLRAAINGDTYSSNTLDDRATGTLSLSTRHSGEGMQSNLTVSYVTEPTIETELLDSGVIIDSSKQTASLSTDFSYNIDERNLLSASLSFSQVGYDTPSLNEYQNSAITIGWGYQLSETSRVTTNFTLSQYNPETTDVTDNNSLKIGYEISASEVTSYSFSVGASRVDGPVNSETGSNYSFVINHQGDALNRFTLTAANSYQASGLGVVREEDKLNLNWTHAFSERMQGMLSTNFVAADDRDYLAIQTGASYNISRNISISGVFRIKGQQSSISDAESNSLLFTLSYHD